MCTDCDDEGTTVPIGPTGPAGPTGPDGETGDGAHWLSGIGIPDPALGEVGDMYVNTETGDIYGPKTDSGWGSLVFNITGEQGIQGIQGDDGEQGLTGGNCYTSLADDAIPLGGNLYQVPLVDASFVVVGQTLFIQDAGTYLVTSIVADSSGEPTDTIIIQNLLYSTNDPTDLIVTKAVTPTGIQGTAGTNGVNAFIYETVDGNGIPAESTTPYSFLMRNETNTGYVFVNLNELKTYLASI